MNRLTYQVLRFSSNTPIAKREIGLIGVGNVGQAIIRNLQRGGYNLTAVVDQNPAQLRELPYGVAKLATPGELAQECDVIVTALPTPANVRDVMEGRNGVISSIRPGSLWIDHSTTDYEQTIDFARRLEAAGAEALEAPVTGGMALLKQGKMTTLVGGQRSVFDHALPLFQQSCQTVLYMGAIGSATITKVISNMLAAAHNVLTGEALMMAKKSGVDLKAFFDGIRVSAGNSFVFETEAPLIFNGSYDPDFTIDLHCKDLKLGYELARKYGSPLPVHALVEQIYNHARFVYGDKVGSSHPPKLLEDSLRTSLQTEGFDDWTYSVEKIDGGSFGVVHKKKGDH